MANNDVPFPPDAYHDHETGLYTRPDPPEVRAEGKFEERKVGDVSLWVPQPTTKPIRMMQFSEPHAYLEVEQSMEECQRLVTQAWRDDAPDWFQFREPTFGTATLVPRAQLRKVCWIGEGFKDLEAVELQLKQAEHAKHMGKLQMIQQQRRG